jgi:hypothetical protein
VGGSSSRRRRRGRRRFGSGGGPVLREIFDPLASLSVAAF